MQTWEPNPDYDQALDLMTEDPEAAVPLFKSALMQQPDRPRIHINLAWALSNLGRHDAAVAAARRARKLDDQDSYVAARLVHVLFEAEEFDELVHTSREVSELPDLEEQDRRYVHQARCWALMPEDPVAAQRESESLVDLWPEHPEALAAHACALAALCRWDEGLEWMDKAIDADPTDARFDIRRTEIVAARDTALTLLKKLRSDAKRHPKDAEGWRELGIGLARFARLEEALEAFERANTIDPIEEGADVSPLVAATLMVEATIRSALIVGEIGPIG